MSQNFRHPEIIALARRDGKVLVEDLAQRFDVTLQTIRRDLTDLAEAGQLERVHGGAVLPSGTANIGYDERRALNTGPKAAMAAAAAQRIANGTALFLGIGTSTEALARALTGKRDLLVVTNNTNVALTLASHDGCEVIVTGGSLRPADAGLVGELALRTIRQFKFDLAVIGCSALDEDGDLLDFDIRETAANQAILEQSRQVFLLADRSKLQRTAPVRVASLADFDAVFTDAPLPQPLEASCGEWGTEVAVV